MTAAFNSTVEQQTRMHAVSRTYRHHIESADEAAINDDLAVDTERFPLQKSTDG